jgi:isoleucyl-tRNA synthetase
MPALKAHLDAADGATVRRALEQDGEYRVELDGETIVLDRDDIEVRAASHEEFALAQEDGIAVALDTTLDDALRREGTARDLVRALNDLRKATGLEIADRITVTLRAEGSVATAIAEHGATIANEVLATAWTLDEAPAAEADGWHLLTLDDGTAAARIERA